MTSETNRPIPNADVSTEQMSVKNDWCRIENRDYNDVAIDQLAEDDIDGQR
ncbi:hypothetical protein ACOJIV_19470 [Haloarcula sp. AONF1]